ncbi:MAG: hypothetical protein CME62_06475 [Halobacteriovoraceae bacterium]|nr:hypothetical protein [Halobacteriovoraceae bacterium]|tara:strand:+ start:11801 stop:12160 length:360 start_codon:yes stop_codon:yes gene_type:complete
MKNLKVFLCLMLSLSIFNISIAQATNVTSNAQMVSTMDAVNSFDRAAVETKIKTLASSDEVKAKLSEFGLTENEIDLRLASLSDAELAEFDQNIQQAQAGGILVAILVVILIIYFAQRI